MKRIKMFLTLSFLITSLVVFSGVTYGLGATTVAASFTISNSPYPSGSITVDNSKYIYSAYYSDIYSYTYAVVNFSGAGSITINQSQTVNLNLPNGVCNYNLQTFNATGLGMVFIYKTAKNSDPSIATTTPSQNGAFHTERRAT